MADESTSSWSEVRRTLPLNARRMAFYGRLMEAEATLETERRRRGISEADYEAAQLVDPVTGEEETDDIVRLARSVEALGGRLEVTAVFPDATLRLLSEPEI